MNWTELNWAERKTNEFRLNLWYGISIIMKMPTRYSLSHIFPIFYSHKFTIVLALFPSTFPPLSIALFVSSSFFFLFVLIPFIYSLTETLTSHISIILNFVSFLHLEALEFLYFKNIFRFPFSFVSLVIKKMCVFLVIFCYIHWIRTQFHKNVK